MTAPIARLKELVDEHEKPWRNEEAMEIVLVELDRNQEPAGEALGCSAATISTWKNKLEIGDETEAEQEAVEDEGVLCPRCELNDTPDNPANELCTECMDFIREQDSNFNFEQEYSDEVINA